MDSDYDSALPTMFLTLLNELCLSVSDCILIKLHMDPNATDSTLQKTLPVVDPAAFYHFTTEVSEQTSVLASHQQQLNRLLTHLGADKDLANSPATIT